MTAFDDLDDYLSLARVTGLAISQDGSRLIATVSQLNNDGTDFIGSLWQIDPSGSHAPRKLTLTDCNESAPTFAHDGSLLFISQRDTHDEAPALWKLPPTGGEARRLLSRPGGIDKVVAARESDTVVIATSVLPGSADTDADQARRNARKDAGVAAVLHTESMVRLWDQDLGPGAVHLQALSASDVESTPIELTPAPGLALLEASFVLTPDGTAAITTWESLHEPGLPITKLAAIDTTTGERRVLADGTNTRFRSPAVSRDGRWVVATREELPTYDCPPRHSLWVLDLASGEGRESVSDPDIWPEEPQFSADGAAIYFVADSAGDRPIFRLDMTSEKITRVTGRGHFTDVQIAPDGTLYALRDHIDHPPTPVRIDPDGSVTWLRAPGTTDVPGRLERVSTTAADGTIISGWLAMPEMQTPAPLLLWVHGGPLSTWNFWSWRWNPWLMVAKGFAVLLPDTALSTGYGAQMIERGWGQWGGTPYTDLMTITDYVVARSDIDETRTAVMGGSWGGYMANWIATQTERFRCIVSHTSIWALDQFQVTTDFPGYWVREWGFPASEPERYVQWSPHHFLDSITTPMLVVHGNQDFRVPIGEALRLWADLQRKGITSKFLYFPDEGHVLTKPGNLRVWYETVWAWLAEHVFDRTWQQPPLL